MGVLDVAEVFLEFCGVLIVLAELEKVAEFKENRGTNRTRWGGDRWVGNWRVRRVGRGRLGRGRIGLGQGVGGWGRNIG